MSFADLPAPLLADVLSLAARDAQSVRDIGTIMMVSTACRDCVTDNKLHQAYGPPRAYPSLCIVQKAYLI